MRYAMPLHEARLVRRYNRFLADVILPDGSPLTVHCPNSGSMAGLLDKGNPVRISGPHGAHRKLRYTLEQIRVRRRDGGRIWVGVNTSHPNHVVREAIEARRIPGLESYDRVRSEVKLGEHSRMDLFLEGSGLPPCWVEVKNCTMVQQHPHDRDSINMGRLATFPDAVTSRGAKHLDELVRRVREGERAVMIYTVQRSDCDSFGMAEAYDPDYSARFRDALALGVEAMPFVVRVRRDGLWLRPPALPVVL